jgi:sterol desaturase/sphingolipid hydroxylase (fatty acid hydroxylase superfamily)
MTFLQNYANHLVFIFSAALLFIPLELLLPRLKEQKLLRSGLKLDVTFMLLGVVGTMLAATVFVTIMVGLLVNIVPEAAKSFVGAQPIWSQVILLIVVGDLYYYWAHRLFHTVPALWKFHAVHHSIEEMGWVAAHRTHPIDTAITNSGLAIIVVLFDFNVTAYAIFSTQFAWHSLLKHSNVAVGWGFLRWIYVTPRFHHWHHANVAEAHDKNFAAQFPLWDVLFGTALMTGDRDPPKYGVDDPVPDNFLGALAYPLKPERIGDAAPVFGPSAAD